MRSWVALIALGALCVPAAARADGEIVIELKGLPPQPAAQSAPGAPAPKPGAGGAVSLPVLPPPHTGVARRATAPPPQKAAVPVERAYGQLAVTLGSDNPIYRKPDRRSPVLSRPAARQYVVVQQPQGEWYAVLMADGSTGYILASQVELLDYRVTDVQFGGGPAPGAGAQLPNGTPLAVALLTEAYRYLGVPYVWGGNDERGLDCSGFVKRCFTTCGVTLPRRASEQALVGQPVEFHQLQPGDRLYFSVKKEFDHTGIYVGDGYFIHSSSAARGVVVDHLSSRFYSRTLSAARR